MDSFDMLEFNAQIVNSVNAYSANERTHTWQMAKQAQTDPSPFWKRLVQAWAPRGLPTTQNGVAKKFKMSQGSTRRWFTGDGLPETERIMEIARLGKVTVEWLLTGNEPRTPVAPGSDLDALLKIWGQLDSDNHSHLLRAAEGQLARQHQGRGGGAGGKSTAIRPERAA